MEKVFCVWEESEHEDVYERDSDGKYLVDIFEKRDDALKAMESAFLKVKRDGDDFERIGDSRINLSRFDEVVKPNGEAAYALDCTWHWSVTEQVVRHRFDEHLEFEVRSTGEDIDGECEVLDIRTGGTVNLGKFPTRGDAEKFVLSQPDEDE